MKTGQGKSEKLTRIVQRRNSDFVKMMQERFGKTGTRACNTIYRAFSGLIDLDDMPLEYVMAYCHPEVIRQVRHCGPKSQELVKCVQELYLKGPHAEIIQKTIDMQEMLMLDGGLSPLTAAWVALELMWNYHIVTEAEFIDGVAGIILSSDPHVSSLVLERLEEVYPKILKRGSLYSDPVTLVIQQPDGTRFSYARTCRQEAKRIIEDECRINDWTAARSGMFKKTGIMFCLTKRNEEEKKDG